MAVASMHLGVWSWPRQSPDLQTECQNGKYFFWYNCIGIYTIWARISKKMLSAPCWINATLRQFWM